MALRAVLEKKVLRTWAWKGHMSDIRIFTKPSVAWYVEDGGSVVEETIFAASVVFQNNEDACKLPFDYRRLGSFAYW